MCQGQEVLSYMLSSGLCKEKVAILINELYSKYGNLYNIIHADRKSLLNIKGMGNRRVELLKSIPIMTECYSLSKLEYSPPPFKMNDLVNYLSISLKNLKFEVFTVAGIDHRKRFLGVEKMFKGSINSATLYPRDVVQYALKLGASYLVLAHNHPSGIASPSKEDIEITKLLYKALIVMNITIVDHIIIAGNVRYSFKNEGVLDKIKDNVLSTI